MKKKIICIIDFGQSHLKFNLITQNYRVTRTLIFKNNFVFSYNNSIFYDHLKITKKIKFHINKISENYHIIAISFVGHGSACFYIDEDNVIKNGFHFSSTQFSSKICNNPADPADCNNFQTLGIGRIGKIGDLK